MDWDDITHRWSITWRGDRGGIGSGLLDRRKPLSERRRQNLIARSSVKQWLMHKRSSIKKAKRDFSQFAFDIVAQATGKKPTAKPADVSEALDNEELRKQVMREMGSRGGKIGGKARASKLSPEKRAEIAQMAAKRRWKKSED